MDDLEINDNVRYAADEICYSCKKEQAIAFYPVIDIDLLSHAYCRKCLDRIKFEYMILLSDNNEKLKQRILNSYEGETAKKTKKASK